MKILHVITKANWGGAQKYVYDVATDSIGRGHDVSVVTGKKGVLCDRLQTAGISITSIDALKRDVSLVDEVRVGWQLYSYIKKERPNIIHLHSSKIGAIGSLIGRIYTTFLNRKARVIFTAHGWAFKETHRSPIARLAIAFISWLTILLSHGVIVLSHKEHEMVCRWPFARKKLHVISIGIDGGTYVSMKEARARMCERLPELQKSTETTWIGSIGELHMNKGFDVAIEAMNNIEDAIYIIIGDGEERARLLSLIEKHNLANRVFLAGNQEDARALLPAFTFFIQPSRKEGLPYTILEAGDANLPVIASNVGGIPEAIIPNETGTLIEPENVEDLSRAIINYMRLPDVRELHANNLHNHIQNNYSKETMLATINDLYLKHTS